MSARITPEERAALPVARAALESRGSAYGPADAIVFALGGAGLLQSPETVAELETLRHRHRLDGSRLLPEQFAEIRAREAAATAGPWGVYDDGTARLDIVAGLELTGTGYTGRREIAQTVESPMDNDPAHLGWGEDEDDEQARADGVFIAAARSDVPALLAELDEMRAVLAQSEQELTGARLSLWEEEQETRRVRLALKSARRGRARAREESARRTKLLRSVQKIARDRIAEAKGRAAYGKRLEARVAELESERHSTNEALDDAVKAIAEKNARIADLETGPALPWAAAMPDDDLHLFLNDLASAAISRWQSDPDVPDRDVLAAIEKACADWRTPGEGYRSDESEAGESW